MITVIADFNQRVGEIDSYFVLLDQLIEQEAIIYFPNKRSHKFKRTNQEQEKVLKANCFLLLYNLIESSVKLSITEIYDTITSKGVLFADVIDEIKKLWLREKYKNFDGLAEGNIFTVIESINGDSLSINFNPNKLISGNIDRQKIEAFSSKYGFSMNIHYSAGDGSKLHQVKTFRNQLAHGNISFSECGRQFTVEELLAIKNQVVRYLRQVLKNIEKYCDAEEFIR